MKKVHSIRSAQSHTDPDTLLEMCKGEFTDLIVIGYNKEGQLSARPTAAIATPSHINIILDSIKLSLLMGLYETDPNRPEVH